MGNDFYITIGIFLFTGFVVYIDNRVKKKNLSRDATWLCAKCEKQVSPWSKRIFLNDGGVGGYTVKVCDRCFIKNRIKNIVVYGLILLLFVAAFWLAL
jgi:hypothetical protein